MSSVLLPLITSACLGLPSNNIDVCNKSSEAFVQQTGIDQKASEYEHLAEKYAKSQARALLMDSKITSVAFIVNTAVTKSISIKASPNVEFTAIIDGSRYSLGFNWRY